jgi:hypothetical protein
MNGEVIVKRSSYLGSREIVVQKRKNIYNQLKNAAILKKNGQRCGDGYLFYVLDMILEFS